MAITYKCEIIGLQGNDADYITNVYARYIAEGDGQIEVRPLSAEYPVTEPGPDYVNYYALTPEIVGGWLLNGNEAYVQNLQSEMSASIAQRAQVVLPVDKPLPWE